MRSAEITITGTITIKLNEDGAKVEHRDKSRNNHNINGRVIKHKVNNDAKHHDNNRKHTTNKTGSGMIPKKVLHINEYEAHHPSPEVVDAKLLF